MTADLREALKRVPRYALSTDNGHIVQSQRGAWVRFEDLRALLPTAPAPEPVAWIAEGDQVDLEGNVIEPRTVDWYYSAIKDLPVGTKLYASPPHQTESETGAGTVDRAGLERPSNYGKGRTKY
jgi:hypothetical protein